MLGEITRWQDADASVTVNLTAIVRMGAYGIILIEFPCDHSHDGYLVYRGWGGSKDLANIVKHIVNNKVPSAYNKIQLPCISTEGIVKIK